MAHGVERGLGAILKPELAQDIRRAPWTIGQLAHCYANLYNVEVKHRGQLYNKRLEERNLLLPISKGWYKPKDRVEQSGRVQIEVGYGDQDDAAVPMLSAADGEPDQ